MAVEIQPQSRDLFDNHEEMLLHTNEGVEPHTKATLRHIKELREKHGIDYDSHGSYRFVEE